MSQLPLFDPQHTAYPASPCSVPCDTSEAAAESIEPTHLRRAVLTCFGTTGRTCDEVEVLLDLRHQTASARIRELVMLGFLKDSGERRATRSGRQARVYVR